MSWHRFNKKLVDKNLTMKFASKHICQNQESIAAFKTPLNKEDFPNVKPADLIDRINENLATMNYFTFSVAECKTLLKIFDRFKGIERDLKGTDVEVIMGDGLYALKDDYFLEMCVGMGLRTCSYGFPSNSERFDAMGRFAVVVEENDLSRNPFHNVRSEDKLAGSMYVSEGNKTGMSHGTDKK